MLSMAWLGPMAVGLKVTVMVQLVIVAVRLQSSLSRKSDVLGGPMLLMVSAAPPVLVTVTACAGLVWPTNVPAKSRAEALSVMPGPRAFPVSGPTWLTPDPSRTVSEPVAGPPVVGAKVTVIEQLDPSAGAGCSVAGNVPQLSASVNPLVVEMLLTVRAPLLRSVPNPVFVKVTGAELVVPAATPTKASEVGWKLTNGPTPVPDKDTPGELLKASLPTDSTPARTLPAVGVKV